MMADDTKPELVQDSARGGLLFVLSAIDATLGNQPAKIRGRFDESARCLLKRQTSKCSQVNLDPQGTVEERLDVSPRTGRAQVRRTSVFFTETLRLRTECDIPRRQIISVASRKGARSTSNGRGGRHWTC